MHLEISPEINTNYTVVFTGCLGAEHREIIEVNDLSVESCRTLEIRIWVHWLVWQKSLQSWDLEFLCHLWPVSYTEAKPFSVRQGVFKKI